MRRTNTKQKRNVLNVKCSVFTPIRIWLYFSSFKQFTHIFINNLSFRTIAQWILRQQQNEMFKFK